MPNFVEIPGRAIPHLRVTRFTIAKGHEDFEIYRREARKFADAVFFASPVF